ncbi:MAG TPA: STAS domain-containing protein [Solirubrobacteraceae bacterium]|nr:STAS domain-containing protein [Solirubrobacteraceae bacterium]
MKRHQMEMAESVIAGRDHAAAGSGAVDRTHTAHDNNQRNPAAPGKPAARNQARFAQLRAASRMHTLVLSGSLDRGSVHELEREIERVCAEGVAGITLDLRGLSYIEPIGVAVIGIRCRLCLRRGFEFALVRGPRNVQRAFEKAGLSERLPFTDAAARERKAWPARRTAAPELDAAPAQAQAPAPALMLAQPFNPVAGGGRR